MRGAVECALIFDTPYTDPRRDDHVYDAIGIDERPPAGMAMHLSGHVGDKNRGIGLWRSREELDRYFVMVVSGAVTEMVREVGALTDARGEAIDIQPNTVAVEDVLLGPRAARFAVPGVKDSRELVAELERPPVLIELNLPELDGKQYSAAIERSGLKSPMPESLVMHFAGKSPDGIWIDQIWLSESEARESFENALAPALKAVRGDGGAGGDAITVFELDRFAINGEFSDGLVY